MGDQLVMIADVWKFKVSSWMHDLILEHSSKGMDMKPINAEDRPPMLAD
jgi:hypothetical protein